MFFRADSDHVTNHQTWTIKPYCSIEHDDIAIICMYKPRRIQLTWTLPVVIDLYDICKQCFY